MVQRIVKLPNKQSFFLFGARGTGKSTLLRAALPESDSTLWVDLLDPENDLRLRAQPTLLRERIEARLPTLKTVVIDEIQKIPALLDTVHAVIERHGVRFALTGSSARKLKAGGANLLAGRAVSLQLHPFTARELGDAFSLESALRFGTLPGLLPLESEEEKNAFLRAYASMYMKEEVWAEQLVRKLDAFSRFLEVAAQSNGKIVNVAAVARDVGRGTDDKTIRAYFEILEDTLVGFHVPAFAHSFRKRLGQKPKFYFFDPGVSRALSGYLRLVPTPSTSLYGDTFEHFIVAEIRRRLSYSDPDARLSYVRTKDDAEVDLVIERAGQPLCLVEIKSSVQVHEEDLRVLSSFATELNASALCLCCETSARQIGNVRVLPWREGIDLLLA